MIIMLNKQYLIFLFLVLLACKPNKIQLNESSVVPTEVSVNVDSGYVVNLVSGDSIQPILKSNGNEVVSGQSYIVKGKIIHTDSVDDLVIKTMVKPIILNTNKNIKNTVSTSQKIPLNLNDIPLVSVEEGDSLFELLNKSGDTLKTNIEQNFNAIVEKVKHSPPIKAKSMVYKDNAIFNIQYMDVDQGLPSSYIPSIIINKDGNICFGTKGGGVAIFNGETFTNIGTKQGLQSDYVNLLFEDIYGNLWISTNKLGITIYDGKKLYNYTEKNGLSSNDVRSIYEDSKGNVWVGSLNGVTKITFNKNGSLASANFVTYTTKEGLSDNVVLSIIEHNNGDLWFGTSRGVNIFNGKAFKQLDEKSGLHNNVIISLLNDAQGAIWIGTYGGVNRFFNDSIIYVSEENGLVNNIIYSIYQSKSGDLWFSTKGGMSKLKFSETDSDCNFQFTNLTEKQGLSKDFCKVVIEDKNNNLWIGTRGGGVCVYKENSFQHFTTFEGLLSNEILSMNSDKKGNMWLGARNNGVSKYNGKTFEHYLIKENDYVITVRSILEDSKNNLWFGTYRQGIIKYDPKKKSYTKISKKEGLSGKSIYSIMEDQNNNMWIGTNDGGITIFNQDSIIHYTEEEGLSSNTIYTLKEDEKGNVWIGSAGGLSKFIPNKTNKSLNHKSNQLQSGMLINYTEKEGLSNTFVRSILIDHNNILWLGTDGGGLNRFDENKVTYYTDKEGLSNNTIWSLQEDFDHSIWLTTEFGVNKLEDSKDGYKLITTYGKPDGLKGTDFFNNSSCINHNNVLWMGSGKNLTMLNLNNIKPSNNPPQIELVGVSVNTKFIDFNDKNETLMNQMEFENVKPFTNYPEKLKLPYNLNHLTFFYAGTDWKAQHKIKYSYILEGLNYVWSDESSEIKADYRNLPYGKYTFKVKGKGKNNIWSKPIEYKFQITPPWWHTWWARAIYILVFIFVIYSLIRWRTKKLKDRQLVLESEIDIATQEIRMQKEIVESAHKIAEQQKLEVEEQKEIIEETHREIKDSINYAKRLQDAILPSKNLINKYFSENFIYSNPKDIVSGDFYWFNSIKDKNDNLKTTNYIAAADCTGHGVPGALVSIVCSNSLDRAVKEFGLRQPSEILNKTRKLVIETFAKNGENVKDGMDIALCAFEGNSVTYAGANNPLWIVRKVELLTNEQKLNKSTFIIGELALIEIKGDKQPIGLYEGMTPFTQHEIEIYKDDFLYFFTDGFADQFGGDKGKKLKYKPFKELLIEFNNESADDINIKLDNFFEEWKGSLEQIDDVCIIGIRI